MLLIAISAPKTTLPKNKDPG